MGFQGQFLRPAADQQYTHFRPLQQNFRERLEQQIKPLVGIKRTNKAQHRTAGQTQARLQSSIGHGAGFELVDVDRIRDHRHLAGRHTSPDDVATQAFADGEYMVGTLERMGFHAAGQPVAQAALARRAMVDRGILPERAHLVDHRNAQAPPNPQRRQGIQHWRVHMQDLRLHLFSDLL